MRCHHCGAPVEDDVLCDPCADEHTLNGGTFAEEDGPPFADELVPYHLDGPQTFDDFDLYDEEEVDDWYDYDDRNEGE